ncbi:MAG TPA: hypothetical protein VF721_04985 [Pyrinomonadaceae bacterium]|jgi:hypothetical protein
MRPFIILIFCGFIFASCANVKTASNETAQTASNETVPVLPAAQEKVSLKPVKPNVKLNSKRKKYLNDSLPPQIREVLEKAEKFEVLAEVYGENEKDKDLWSIQPNRIAKITGDDDKKKILEAFYRDAAEEDSPASCYEPHHLIRAVFQEKTVEVEICFSCARFVVKDASGKFEGTIVRENRRSEDIFNRIIQNKSVGIKQ